MGPGAVLGEHCGVKCVPHAHVEAPPPGASEWGAVGAIIAKTRRWAGPDLAQQTPCGASLPSLQPLKGSEGRGPSLGNFQKGFVWTSSCSPPHLPLSCPSRGERGTLTSCLGWDTDPLDPRSPEGMRGPSHRRRCPSASVPGALSEFRWRESRQRPPGSTLSLRSWPSVSTSKVGNMDWCWRARFLNLQRPP